ncbi:MAG TPA: DUF1592 domain-containing protein [Bryobacteraceae bacterium]|nr:DUF1592 domain-containing protein [Bryobacteraceae bacterium]
MLFLTVGAFAASQPPVPFREGLYPALLKAGCHNCHNPDGVSSGTRLHFPEESASAQRITAFGKSLVGLVNRQRPETSALLLKPTNRTQHTGGERIKKNSREELLLKQWIAYLAAMSDEEIRQAALYKGSESRSYGAAPAVVLRRLTHRQYANTIRDLLHEPTDVSTHFAPEDFVDGFKNQYQSQSLSPTLIEAYSQEAERLADNAFRRGDSRHLIPCDYTGGKESSCRLEFIRRFGQRAFRRPLQPEEVARYEAMFRREANFQNGAHSVVEAMLQAPSFLFWMDSTPRAEWKRYATASRLAYFLWNSTPDDALLNSAAGGELDTPDGVERAARRMLADPKAKRGLDEFVTQWLRFDRALASARQRRTFPMFSRELVVAMTEEARRFVGDLVWNGRNFMDAFRASYGFVNSDLAAVYKVPAPARDFERVDFPADQERPGLLGQALFLTLTSKPEDTAPTARGLFIREQFLCQQVPPPPPGVDTNLPSVHEDRPVTNRERLAAHTTNNACAGCHSLIDPIGFGLEKFDAIGARREKMKLLFYPDVHQAKVPKKEVELDLDLSGQIAGVPDSRFSDSRRLGELLAGSELCQECIVKQVFRYMSGRHETRADAPRIRRSLEEFRSSGFRFQELLVSLVKTRDDTVQRSANGERNHKTH